jgi:hypothetical protein
MWMDIGAVCDGGSGEGDGCNRVDGLGKLDGGVGIAPMELTRRVVSGRTELDAGGLNSLFVGVLFPATDFSGAINASTADFCGCSFDGEDGASCCCECPE